ncbi:hypothetical protein [Streptomyces sp. NPDC055287]
MELLAQAAPGVEALAGEVADAACALADAASPTAWNLAAAEDAVNAIGTLAEALAAIDPESARLLAAIPTSTKALLRHLGQDDAAENKQPPCASPERRGLGHGWQGVRVPSAER